MPRARWPLLNDRPSIQVVLTLIQGGQPVARNLLADTGAGTATSGFELLLEEQDCLLCGGIPAHGVTLGGAYVGSYPVYLVQVRIPILGFDHTIPAVGVPTGPAGFDGIACFQFLNRFSYGNFADAGHFGLEV
jgi:hypothetical protein